MSSNAEMALILKAKDLASSEVDKLHKSLGRLHGGIGNVAGALTDLVKVGIFGVIAAITAVVGYIGLATKAAENEQVATARLTTAIHDSVKGHKDQTAAIDAGQARMVALGFTTVEYRNSLARLVLETHNVRRAQQLQTTAADLARLKHISLTDASLMVVRAMEGNKRVLKELGISVDKHATKQEILAAIMKKTAGQAEAYGKTAAGAQEQFGAALDEVTTNVGAAFLPIMTQAMQFMTTTVIPIIRTIVARVQDWVRHNGPLLNSIRETFVKVVGMAVEKVKVFVGWVVRVFDTITSNRDVMNVLRTAFKVFSDAVGVAWSTLSTLLTWLSQVWNTISTNKNVIAGFSTVWRGLGTAVNIVVDAFKWLLHNAGKVIDTLSHLKLPDITGITNLIPHFATGGKVPGPRGMPQLAILHGQETVTKAGNGTGATPVAAGVTIVGVTERDIVDMMDRHLYFRLRRAGTGS